MVLSFRNEEARRDPCPMVDATTAVPKDVLNFLGRYKPIDCDCCNTTVAFLDRQTGRIKCNPQIVFNKGGSDDHMVALEASMNACGGDVMKVGAPVDVVDGHLAKPAAKVASSQPTPVKVSVPASPVGVKVAVGATAASPDASKTVAAPVRENPVKPAAVAPAVEAPKKVAVASGTAAGPAKVAGASFVAPKIYTESERKAIAEMENPFVKPVPVIPSTMSAAKPTGAISKTVVKESADGPASQEKDTRTATPAAKTSGQPLINNPFMSKRAKNSWLNMIYSPNLKTGSNVKATHFYDLNKFQVQALDDEDAAFAVQEKIASYIQDNAAKTYAMLNKKPVIDEVVLGSYNGEYYRARVMNVREKECTMIFIDYGDTGVNTYDVLYEISEELMQVPVYSLTLGLLGVPREVPKIELDVNILNRLYEKVILELSGPMFTCEAMQADGTLRDPTCDKTINEYVITFLQEQK